VAGALAGLGACSGVSQPSASPGVTIRDPWILVAGGIEQPAAGYLTIANTGSTADALTSVSSPGAASVEIHETAMDSSGMMGMHPVTRLDCPIGGTVSLAPGGYHLMITGLKAVLKAGDLFELDLVFEHAGTIVVQAEVRQA
jgi:copper(I)-binding protein